MKKILNQVTKADLSLILDNSCLIQASAFDLPPGIAGLCLVSSSGGGGGGATGVMVGSGSGIGGDEISGFILAAFLDRLSADDEAFLMEGDGFGGVGAPSLASSLLSKSFSAKVERFRTVRAGPVIGIFISGLSSDSSPVNLRILLFPSGDTTYNHL